jgi:predicted nucleotidyltransferase
MQQLGMRPNIPEKPEALLDAAKLGKWRKEKNMKVFSFVQPELSYLSIDVMIENYFIFNVLYRRRKHVKAWGIDVSVASLEDVIKLKEISARQQDLADIEALRKYGKK